MTARFMLDRHILNVRSAWYDSSSNGSGIDEWVRAVPGMEKAFALSDWRSRMRMVSRIWRVTTAGSDRQLLVDFGAAMAYSEGRAESLMDVYVEAGRRLEPVIERLWDWMV